MSLELTVIESCEGCGACCLEQESPPGYIGYLSGTFTHDDDDPDSVRVRQLPEKLVNGLRRYMKRLQRGKGHPNNGICLWFDEETRQCKYYEHRPEICREAVHVGDDSCREWRNAYGVKPN